MRGHLTQILTVLLVAGAAACGDDKPACPVAEATIEPVKGSLELGDCENDNGWDRHCKRFIFEVKNTGPGCADATSLAGGISLRTDRVTTNVARWELEEKDPPVFAVGETRRAKQLTNTLEPGDGPFKISTTTKTDVACQ